MTHWKWLASSASALPTLQSSAGSRMARRRTGASHGHPLLGCLLQVQGVKASGATQIIPREPAVAWARQLKPPADFTPGLAYLPPRGANILVSLFPDSPAEQENYIWSLSFLLFRFPGGFSVPEYLVLAASPLPRGIWLPIEVGLSSSGYKHRSPQELPLTTESKKRKVVCKHSPA